MADNSGIIKVAAIGVAAYVAYTQGWLSFLGIAAPATPATAAAASTTGTGTSSGTGTGTGAGTGSGTGTGSGSGGGSTPPPAKPKLSDIQAATILAANAPAAGLGVDQWGYYLNQVLAPYGMAAPDPMPLFSGMFDTANQALQLLDQTNNIAYTPQTFSRSDLVTSATYWGVMGPALKSQLGLTGLGMYWRTA